MSDEKNQYYQYIRGLCIIFVILIHCYAGNEYPVYSFSYNFWMVVRSAIGIAVPLFFAMSGYFTKTNRNKFIDLRLLIPFIVWGFIYEIYTVFQIGEVSVVKSIAKVLLGQSGTQLYFVFVLLQIRAILPVFLKYQTHKLMFPLIVVMTLLWYGLYYMVNIFNLFKWPFPLRFADLFPAWFLYWYIGYMARNNPDFLAIKKKVISVMCIIGLILTICESYCIGIYIGDINPTTQMKISNLFYCTSVCLFIFDNERVIKKRTLITRVGDYSYGIYYIHLLFIMIINRYFVIKPVYPIILVYIVEFSVVFLLSILSLIMLRKIFGERFSQKYLGV